MLQRICSLLRIRPPLTENKGLLSGSGAVIPNDGSSGWQTAAVFQKTNGTADSALYMNVGTIESSAFKPILSYEPN